MNRRDFFKVLGASAAAIALPSIALAPSRVALPTAEEILGFIAGREYGMAVFIPGLWGDYAKWTSEFLIDNAREHMPKGTVIEIRLCGPCDFGRSQQAAWYTNQWIAISQPSGLRDLEVNRMGGYFTAGKICI